MKEPHKEIEYTVNGKIQETDQKELTARQILVNAQVDPESNYLVEIVGKKQISYKDNPDDILKMKKGMKFITISTGPTPVS